MHYVAELMINFKHPGRPQYLLKWAPTDLAVICTPDILWSCVYIQWVGGGGGGYCSVTVAQVDVEHLMHFIAVLFNVEHLIHTVGGGGGGTVV